MKHHPRIPVALLGFAALVLGACGGGSGPIAGGGIGGTGKPGVKFGEVTVGGGVTVSGTTFDVSTASVMIGGASASTGDVRDGHVALVRGIIDGATGTASTVTIEEVVKGELQGKPSASTLTVQGQTVEVDERTVYGPGISPASPAGLLLGDFLEVWGFVKAPGVVLATRIEREDSLSERRLIGTAVNVNASLDTFEIGGQAIAYGSADVSGLAGGDPVEGQLVRVDGAALLGPGGVVNATRVEPIELEDGPDNDDTEIQGFVTRFVSASTFDVAGVKVQTNAATRYEGGVAADVVLGVALEIEGSFTSGVLLARSVEFRAYVKLESDVAMVAGNLITLVGLPGVVVTVNDLTEYEGNAHDIGDIQPGEHVRIRGRHTGGSSVIASEVDERSADTDIEIQGPVDATPAPSNPFLSILGVSIDTTGIADGEFESPEGAPSGRAAFFAAVAAGDLVKVSGQLTGATPTWQQVEREGSVLTKPGTHESEDD